ncbi:hypothetical protein VTO73DRAFT_2428 [Trametes versicolor]
MSQPRTPDFPSSGKLTHPPVPSNSGSSRGVPLAGVERPTPDDQPVKECTTSNSPDIPAKASLWDVDDKRDEVYTQAEKTEAWTGAARMVETYSEEMIKRWKEEIDTYLVFAGLFSAVLTTFNVQSYLLLQPAAPDPSIVVLQQIASQLASLSIKSPLVNNTQTSGSGSSGSNTPPVVPRWVVWLNALWFSGLILSLTSASVGIMVKQWLNEYSSGVSGSSRPAARVRQYRLNNLRTWRVEDIVGTIPILLQLALALFLAGILILLWNLHSTVAAIASTLVGLLAVFTAVTTLLPLVNPKCSYLTPQRPETWKAHKQTWRGRERSDIDRHAGGLDVQILVEAYSSALHPDALSAATVCLMDFHYRDVVNYFRKLHKCAREHFGVAAVSEDGPLGYGNQQRPLWLTIILCTPLADDAPLSDDEAAALGVYFRCGSWPSSMKAGDAEWAVSSCNALMDHLEGEGPRSRDVRPIDQVRLRWMRGQLIRSAMRREQPLESVLLPGVTGLYRQVRLKHSYLGRAPLVDAKAAHASFLQSVDHFLDCAHHVFASALPAERLETVRAYTRDVLAALTRTMLKLFAEDSVKTIIESTHLDDIMRKLRRLDDSRLEEDIADDLVPDMLHLAGILQTASGYTSNDWVNQIQASARAFGGNIIRVKNRPGTTMGAAASESVFRAPCG